MRTLYFLSLFFVALSPALAIGSNQLACARLLVNDLSGYYLISREEGSWPPRLFAEQSKESSHYPIGLALTLRSQNTAAYSLLYAKPYFELLQGGNGKLEIKTSFYSTPSRGTTHLGDQDLLVIRRTNSGALILSFEDSAKPSAILTQESLNAAHLVHISRTVPVFQVNRIETHGDKVTRLELEAIKSADNLLIFGQKQHRENMLGLHALGESYGSPLPQSIKKTPILDKIKRLDFSKVAGNLSTYLLFAESTSLKQKILFKFDRDLSAGQIRMIFKRKAGELWGESPNDDVFKQAVVELSIDELVEVLNRNAPFIKMAALPTLAPLHTFNFDDSSSD